MTPPTHKAITSKELRGAVNARGFGVNTRPVHLVVSALVGALASLAANATAAVAQSFPDHARSHAAIPITPSRTLNLFCLGEGDRTVLFEAGGSDWSVVWAPVQTAVADQMRACVYDRAGFGFSDPANAPRTPFAIVQDMKRLVDAAGLKTPLILVGHSLGGFNAKLFAVLYPEDIAGLVLLDPAEERWWDRTRGWAVERYGMGLASRSELQDSTLVQSLVARYDACAAAARETELDPASEKYRRCTDPARPALGPEIAASRQALQVRADFQETQSWEMKGSVYADHDADAAYGNLFTRGALGDLPLIVLSHLDPPSQQPIDKLAEEQTVRLHDETAQLSNRGLHRRVAESGHYIQLDQPAAVIQAIYEVRDAAPK